MAQIVDTISEAEGIEPERVSAIARSLREAGLIATKGRGPSAAQMSEKDTANLLIAVNTTPTAREAPEAVKHYRQLQRRREPDRLNPDFGKALESLIAAARDQTLETHLAEMAAEDGDKKAIQYTKRSGAPFEFKIEVSFQRPVRSAEITVTFRRRQFFAAMATLRFVHDPHSLGVECDRREKVAFSDVTIRAVSEALRLNGNKAE